MKSETKYSILFACLLAILLPSVVKAYDPPEVFAVFTGEDHAKPFGDDFCCIDDQNGDGCDEMLVNNDPFIPGLNNYGAVNQVWFYWGGENMDNSPDVVFRTDNDRRGFGRQVIYQGNIIPDLNSFISIGTRFDNDGAHRNLYMYETGEQIDNEVDLILTTPDYDGSSGIWLSYGMRNRPADINGDGFHDIIVKEVNANDDGPYRRLTTYYGGADFDTIPDWRVYTPPWHRVYDFISGFDINGDGYDDIFIDANIEDESKRNFVFLGGDPMDTTVAFDFGVNDFECVDGPACIRDVTVLQDVNDDGYDDWGMYYIESGNPEEGQYDGYFIFFGSEEPDLNPDLELEGVHYGSEHAAASITSGDFNGDGIGDIVTGQSNKAISDYGEICFYFGSRWIEGGEPDLMITNRDDGFRGYPNLGYNVGAAGDYNGDGVDDIVVKSYRDEGREELYQLAILTGSKDWIVGVDEHDQPAVYDLTLKTTPNPFNNSVTISYQVPISGEVKLSIYDVQGRLVEQLQDSIAVAGKHKLTWHSQTSGIYLVLLQTETASVVKKVVCLK